jgi:hypothetical protein
MHLRYEPARHTKSLTEEHKQKQVLYCNDMLEYPSDVRQKIVFSDESRITLGDEKHWVWYRHGADNPLATRTTAKHPPSHMVFAVIGVGFKSKLLVIERTVNAETCRRNIETLAFMDELNQLHGMLQWIFQHRVTLPQVPWYGLDTVVLCWLDGHQTRPISLPLNSTGRSSKRQSLSSRQRL